MTNAPRRGLKSTPRKTRAKPTVSYAEPSSDDDSYDETVWNKEELHRGNAVQRETGSLRIGAARQAGVKRKQHSIGVADQHNLPKRSARQKAQEGNLRSLSPEKEASQIATSIHIPPWQNLPYHIFVQIFRFASYPLYDTKFQPLPSGRWLLNVARLCRSFAEPAITVLYSSPPLVPMVLAHRLVDLLKADPRLMTFKYRQKVEALHIDVYQVAAYSLPGNGQLDLYGLVKDLPRLVDLEFYHQFDMAPYKDLDTPIRWHYPQNTFEALEYVDPSADPGRGDKTSVTKLRSWRWSSRLAGSQFPITSIPEIHMKPSFSSLKKLAFVNYQVPLLKKDEEDPEHEQVISRALGVLEALEHLILESSTLCNSKLLPLLPKTLRNLELINCWEITAADFSDFLLTHGSQLRCLILNHNQSLSLAFLPVLEHGCPKLQILRMDMSYFNIHTTYRDSEPLYESLLLSHQIPLWPKTLQIIELTKLRKWDTDAAEMFFTSLLDNAGKLSDLRRLVVQAILNIGWRDRASFRDKWVGSLNRVFKRVVDPPSRCTTIRNQQNMTTEGSLNVPQDDTKVVIRSHHRTGPDGNNLTNTGSTSNSSRRTTRASNKVDRSGRYAESSDTSDADASDSYAARPDATPRTPVNTRQQQRRNHLSRELDVLKATAGIDAPGVEIVRSGTDLNTKDPLKSSSTETEVIQGKCEIVEIRIDNLRPTETQATEADFLDEEPSGDEDWNGDDADGVSGYAW